MTGPGYIACCNILEWAFGLYESSGTGQTRIIGKTPITVGAKVERWGFSTWNLIRRKSYTQKAEELDFIWWLVAIFGALPRQS